MRTEPPVAEQRSSAASATTRWLAHPAGARAVRLLISSLALIVVAGGTWFVADHLPRGRGWAVPAHYGVLIMVSLTLTLLLDRAARRLLPLAMLLELSVTLPDRLPHRFSVAMRAANTRRVFRELEISEGPSTAGEAITRAVLMLGALAVHDRRTRGHCERVRALNDLMAEELGLDADEKEKLRWAALLHDIGKLEVPSRILNKPSAPSADEWHALRSHPEVGDHMIEPLRPWLGEWADAVVHHHERWDGGGYPRGLAGKDISLAGRIVALVDAYEVMTAVRPYQRPVSPAAARAELVNCSGSHFDPALVRAFLNISIGRLRRALGPVAWLAQFPLIAVAPRLEVAAGIVARQSITTVAAATSTGAVATALAVAATVPGAPAPASRGPAPTPPAAAVFHSHGAAHHSHVVIDLTGRAKAIPADHGSGHEDSALQNPSPGGGQPISAAGDSPGHPNHAVSGWPGNGLNQRLALPASTTARNRSASNTGRVHAAVDRGGTSRPSPLSRPRWPHPRKGS